MRRVVVAPEVWWGLVGVGGVGVNDGAIAPSFQLCYSDRDCGLPPGVSEEMTSWPILECTIQGTRKVVIIIITYTDEETAARRQGRLVMSEEALVTSRYQTNNLVSDLTSLGRLLLTIRHSLRSS